VSVRPARHKCLNPTRTTDWRTDCRSATRWPPARGGPH